MFETDSTSSLIDKLKVVVKKLLATDRGACPALKLCLSFSIDGVKEGKRLGHFDLDFAPSFSARFEKKILKMLRLSEVRAAMYKPSDERAGYLDMADWSRRMWRSMNKRGCCGPPPSDAFMDICCCTRRANLLILNALQGHAHAQIRGRLRLTVASIVPHEVFDSIFEYALLAERIPIDPSVLLPASEKQDGKTRVRNPWKNHKGSCDREQSLFKMQYR